MIRRFRPLVVLAIVAASLVASSCGVPLDTSPRAINQTTVPVDETPTTTPTTSDTPGAATVAVYFLRSGRLEAARYPVEGDSTLRKALELVLGGPQDDATLSTSIPPDTSLLGVTIEGSTAMIDLTSEIGDISGQPGKQAFAQIVFTALSFAEVDTVTFRVEGQPIVAPTDRGNLEAVSAEDYDPPLNPG